MCPEGPCIPRGLGHGATADGCHGDIAQHPARAEGRGDRSQESLVHSRQWDTWPPLSPTADAGPPWLERPTAPGQYWAGPRALKPFLGGEMHLLQPGISLSRSLDVSSATAQSGHRIVLTSALTLGTADSKNVPQKEHAPAWPLPCILAPLVPGFRMWSSGGSEPPTWHKAPPPTPAQEAGWHGQGTQDPQP